jgi:hypothetical protein
MAYVYYTRVRDGMCCKTGIEKSSVLKRVSSTFSLTSYRNFDVVHPIVFKSSVALGSAKRNNC